jgi:hypothetical protein
VGMFQCLAPTPNQACITHTLERVGTALRVNCIAGGTEFQQTRLCWLLFQAARHPKTPAASAQWGHLRLEATHNPVSPASLATQALLAPRLSSNATGYPMHVSPRSTHGGF